VSTSLDTATTPIDIPRRGRQPSGHEVARVQRFRLIVTAGRDGGAIYVSRGARTVVGTHPSADLVLEDPTVSRFHCEIVCADGKATLRDLGSRNGTLVGGLSVVAAHLPSTALIRLGETQLRFELGPDQVEVPVSSQTSFGTLVGCSPALRAVFALLERAAATPATVLLEGETGTGKEAAAESIHRRSPRSAGPFVVVDCGAIPKALLESELFGHTRGAYTSAVAARTGAFAEASGGTIFLDEIGELELELQPKLLRALEKRQVKPVGADRYEAVDVRVIAATNRNLRAEVNAGRFRSDLYYRLSVVPVRIPALREHLEDLPLLVDAFLEQLGVTDGPDAAYLRSAAFQREVAQHTWPGNVRELRNVIERYLALGPDAIALTQQRDVADTAIDASKPLRVARDAWLLTFEREYLRALLVRHDNNVTASASAAGVARGYFYRLQSRHGLR
jgi:two-component system response regulator GlrR